MSAGGSSPTASPKSSASWVLEWRDEWPDDFDGTGLLEKLRQRQTTFRFDVQNLLHEIEGRLGAKIVDILVVMEGSNNFLSRRILPSLRS